MSPVPLEPKNPDSLRAHAFCCVFDYIASQGIDIFHIAKKDEKQLEHEFDRAYDLLKHKQTEVKNHIKRFLSYFGGGDEEIINQSILLSTQIINQLREVYTIENESRQLITWLFKATEDPEVMRIIESKFSEEFDTASSEYKSLSTSKGQLRDAIISLLDDISSLDKKYEEYKRKLKIALLKIKGG